ncbi:MULTISPECIES: thiamine pyrophosphate-binding protein [Anaerotruncus]|uniref:thiamine pyrophosphate-binding protein n=1 Tax=Anaerotruncus TaxID=244127 RepID=UPI0018F5CC57|nr:MULTISPECIES: thiamine pyrophosphate-binding protein [Anaerotruncus]
MKKKGADIIVDYLVEAGVPYAVGLCGHGIIGLMDSLCERQDSIKTLTVRHEQSAGHIADVYYRVKHRPLATFSSCGPGSTNMVTPLATAFMDSSAFLAITGNAPTQQFNKCPFQETGRYFQGDYPSVIRPYVKRSFQPTRVDMLPIAVRQAYNECVEGRPGPVNLDVPFNVFQEEDEVECQHYRDWLPSLMQRCQADPAAVEKVLGMLVKAERPLIVAGNGAVLSEAGAEILAFAKFMGIPVHTSPMGKGIIDERDPICLGATGRNGTYASNQAGIHADLLIALGTSFDDRSTSGWIDGITYDMRVNKLIQVDIDPREIGRTYPVELGIVADIKLFMAQLLKAAEVKFSREKPDYTAWIGRIRDWQGIWDLSVRPLLESDAYPIAPGRLINEIRKALPENGIFLSDVGVHHNWAVQFWKAYESQTIMQSWGFACMGFATAGVVGAKLAAPDRPAVAFVGDGSFLMTPQIVATAVEYHIPAIWVIINNHAFGSIRDLQNGYFKRELCTSFRDSVSGELWNPDYAALARAFGADGVRVERPQDLAPALEAAIKSNRPCVLDVIVDRDIGPIGTGSWQFVPYAPPMPNFVPVK